MNDTAKKIRQLQKMLESIEADQAQPGSWVPEDIEDEAEMATNDATDQAAEDDQGDGRPKSLEGIRLLDLLTMEIDGALSEEEMIWLGSKSVPAGPGTPRMPNLKYINRKNRRI